ncbi:MAG: tRNA pseudouridine(13) synthase TruD [Nanoarchaeota archaeon]|nr:tRNA pseudouridine(13) synthase TruD [Nanoarchaeota archaeon]
MKLKQLPEDFVVKEIADIKLSENGKYACFILKKKNWATTNAIEKIAMFLGKNLRIFNNSGMKDKNAVTEQYVSAYELKKEDIQRVKIKDIKLKFVGFLEKPIGLASHTANSFEITARDLEKPLKRIKYFSNYYGEQRFGGIRPNMAAVGKLIIKGKLEDAMKAYLLYPFEQETEEHKRFRKEMEANWRNLKAGMVPGYLIEKKAVEWLERNPGDYKGAFMALPRQVSTLFIHAYQSKLFNEILAAYIKENCEYFEIHHCFGKIPMSIQNIKLQVPLIGYDYEDFKLEKAIRKYADELLQKEFIKPEMFHVRQIPFMESRTVMRDASAELQSLMFSKDERDELNNGRKKQKAVFILKKGSFATMALKAMAAFKESCLDYCCFYPD